MLSLAPDDEIELRLLQEEDAPELFALAERNRPELDRWLPSWSEGTRSVGECRSLARHALQRHAVSGTHVCGIRHGSALSGAVGLVAEAPWQAEIGYWLGWDYRGRGIMTRSVLALLEYTLEIQQAFSVHIRCDARNVKAAAIPERLGFNLQVTRRSAEYPAGHHHFSLDFRGWNGRNRRSK